jgi:hypothetical protein
MSRPLIGMHLITLRFAAVQYFFFGDLVIPGRHGKHRLLYFLGVRDIY